MASASLRCVGGSVFGDCRFSWNPSRRNAHAGGPCSLATSNDRFNGFPNKARISMSMSVSADNQSLEAKKTIKKNRRNDGHNKAVVSEKLDKWMADSVVEIVKNLREAPLLVQVYSNSDGKRETTMLRTEKAVAEENWAVLMERWEKRESPSPEGVIFVELMEDEDDEDDEDDRSGGKKREGMTRVWGIVVQGKGADSGPACYLLKTTSASAGSVLGHWCTHFFLMRVKNLRESARSQLMNCWLSKPPQQGQSRS